MKEEEEPEEEEEDELGHAETYAEYMPMKCKWQYQCCSAECSLRQDVDRLRPSGLSVGAVKVGIRHPDPVVETSSLSSVSPPDVWYRLSIPEEVIDTGCLSALQLEAITYAAQVPI